MLQTLVSPEIIPGFSGRVITLIPNVVSADVPQLLLALTVIFPPVIPATALIELVAELPVQPEGKVHVYDVALLITGIL